MLICPKIRSQYQTWKNASKVCEIDEGGTDEKREMERELSKKTVNTPGVGKGTNKRKFKDGEHLREFDSPAKKRNLGNTFNVDPPVSPHRHQQKFSSAHV